MRHRLRKIHPMEISAFEHAADMAHIALRVWLLTLIRHAINISTYRYHERGVLNPPLPGARYPAAPRQA